MKIGISVLGTESEHQRNVESARPISVGFNQFGLDLQRLLPPHTNTFFSPLSIGAALTALVPGARGRTAAEIMAMLGLPKDLDEVRSGIAPMTPRVSLATAIFVAESYPLHTSFCDALSDAFEAEFFSQSFDDPAVAADRINEWVSDRTHGRIPHLLDPGSLDPETRLVLANAVYFKAPWLHQFMEDATGPRPFVLRSGERIEVPTMTQQTYFAYGSDEELGYQAIDLPYEYRTSMLVILPDSGRFDEVEASLSPEFLAGVAFGMRQRDVELRLPRFELRFATPLADLLQTLGMKEAFDPKLSDFSGLTPVGEPLAISEVIHQAWVKIDENGTEAAAPMAITTTGWGRRLGAATPDSVLRGPTVLLLHPGP
jgi:serpin B